MSTTRGCFGVIRSGPTGGATHSVGEAVSWSFEETADREDVSAMGTCTKKFSSGAKQTTGSLEVWWDSADSGQADFVVGGKIGLELYPGGNGSGKTYYKGVANIDSVGRQGGVDASVKSTYGFSVDGAFTVTAVP